MKIEVNRGKRRKCFMCDKMIMPGEPIAWFGAKDLLCAHAEEMCNSLLLALDVLNNHVREKSKKPNIETNMPRGETDGVAQKL